MCSSLLNKFDHMHKKALSIIDYQSIDVGSLTIYLKKSNKKTAENCQRFFKTGYLPTVHSRNFWAIKISLKTLILSP